MVAAIPTNLEPSVAEPGEERLFIPNVPWSTYVVLRDSLDIEGSKLLLTYCEGALELMSPSTAHEKTKTLIGRLVEAYAEVFDLELTGRGSETFREEVKKRGLEGDECYSLGDESEVPDLSIEVIYSRPKLDKLDVYRGLGVPEVWAWEKGKLRVFVLAGERYEETTRSKIFPALDVALLASFIRTDENQTKLVKAFRAALARAR
jgi:Uma2 family endonuclease